MITNNRKTNRMQSNNLKGPETYHLNFMLWRTHSLSINGAINMQTIINWGKERVVKSFCGKKYCVYKYNMDVHRSQDWCISTCPAHGICQNIILSDASNYNEKV